MTHVDIVNSAPESAQSTLFIDVSRERANVQEEIGNPEEELPMVRSEEDDYLKDSGFMTWLLIWMVYALILRA